MAAKSKILETIPEEIILFPQPKPFHWRGEDYEIKPLPDSALAVVGDTLGRVGGLLDTVAQQLFAEGGVKKLEVTDLLPLVPTIPQIIAALLPCQSKLVAASLRLDEKTVAQEMPLHKKLEALKLIVESENLPAILAHFGGLIAAFRRSENEIAEG